ncbi:hypothetical protein DXT88_20420 [Herbaspirillum lusitanum]|uniref:hypothetical protein n=1 Tax=Herbaspirillum lusitanum TaxID=213312 RepID=UPI0022383B0B|nr:hypothetical protein [Herbaspirillum lusitanum]MCW5300539.1 hypothetical protein [Herbaspirillum lusitanum]
MDGKDNLIETPAAFLEALGETLSGKAKIDVGLADILKIHVLKTKPAQNAVTQAKTAILKLAAERAAAPKAEVDNG